MYTREEDELPKANNAKNQISKNPNGKTHPLENLHRENFSLINSFPLPPVNTCIWTTRLRKIGRQKSYLPGFPNKTLLKEARDGQSF
jgi:hypothetical protein